MRRYMMKSMEHHANEEYEEASVLVMAKTYPNISREYTELVCTAGLRIDTHPYQWIRLYPIPYRLLEQHEKYKKWQVIKVRIAKRNSDLRPESYQPDPNGKIVPVGDVIKRTGGWRIRAEYLENFYDQTNTCQLLTGAKTGKTQSQSLGIVHPRQITGFDINPNEEFFDKKRSREQEVWTLSGTQVKTVDPSPFTLKFSYKCESPHCKGHTQSVIDWEVGASGYNRLQEGIDKDDVLKILREQFITRPMKKDLWFILGNMHRRPQNFMILSLFYPDKGVVDKIRSTFHFELGF